MASSPRSGGAPCSAHTLALWQGDLDHWLATPKKFDGTWERAGKARPKAGVRLVPTPEPQHLWRRAESADEIDEIVVLREDHYPRLASPIEDLRVFCLSETKIAYVHRIEGELAANPRTELRGNVSIDPEDHGTTTAWLTRLLANRKQA